MKTAIVIEDHRGPQIHQNCLQYSSTASSLAGSEHHTFHEAAPQNRELTECESNKNCERTAFNSVPESCDILLKRELGEIHSQAKGTKKCTDIHSCNKTKHSHIEFTRCPVIPLYLEFFKLLYITRAYNS